MQSRSIHTILCSALLPPRLLGSIRSRRLLLLRFRAGSLSSSRSAHENEVKTSVSDLLRFLLLLRLELGLLLFLLFLLFRFLLRSAGSGSAFLGFTRFLLLLLDTLDTRIEARERYAVVSAEPNVNETKCYLTRESYQRDL